MNRNGKCNCIREISGLSGSRVCIGRMFFLFFCRVVACPPSLLEKKNYFTSSYPHHHGELSHAIAASIEAIAKQEEV